MLWLFPRRSCRQGLSLPSMREMCVSHNKMAQIGDLHGLPALRVLSATDNAIVNTQGLETAGRLQIAELDRNRCKKLASLAQCPSLSSLRYARD